MTDNKQLKNEDLETVAGGTNVESYDGFSVGDWVAFRRDSKTRHSPSGSAGLSRPSYRIRELDLIIEDYVVARLDMYDLNPLGTYTILSGGSSSLDELEHAYPPLNFTE